MGGRRILAALAALALGAAGAAAPAPATAHPALWKIADSDTTIYLFGTFHALPVDFPWQDATLSKAFAAADQLVIETLVGDPAEMAALLGELGTSPTPLPKLLDRVSPARRAALANLVARTPLPLAAFDRMETWAAALLLAQPMMSDLGIASAQGVEERLKADFAARGRPIAGLETVRQQLGFIDQLAEDDQRALLNGLLDQSDDLRSAFAAMLAAWARGDEAAIAATFDKELKGSSTLREALLGRRNAAWAAEVKAMLDRPGTMLVAVGAGHLAGADSLQAALAKDGIRAVRVH